MISTLLHLNMASKERYKKLFLRISKFQTCPSSTFTCGQKYSTRQMCCWKITCCSSNVLDQYVIPNPTPCLFYIAQEGLGVHHNLVELKIAHWMIAFLCIWLLCCHPSVLLYTIYSATIISNTNAEYCSNITTLIS